MTSHSLGWSGRSVSFCVCQLAGLEDSAPPATPPESWGTRLGAGLGLRGGVRRLRAGKGAAWSKVRSFCGHSPPRPPHWVSAPPPLAAVTQETGRDHPPTRNWFHGSHEESSFGAFGGGSGPGHQLDALFGEPRVTFEELSRAGAPGCRRWLPRLHPAPPPAPRLPASRQGTEAKAPRAGPATLELSCPGLGDSSLLRPWRPS